MSGFSPYYRIPGVSHGKRRVHCFAEARANDAIDSGEISLVWRSLDPNTEDLSREIVLAQDSSPWRWNHPPQFL